MESMETRKTGEKGAPDGNRELLPFVPRQNSRFAEDEQVRLEKKVRAYFHSATMKARGKQWDLALADVERATKTADDIQWKEGAARARLMREGVMQKRSSSLQEANAKVVRERFEKRRSARQQRERAEQERLDALRHGCDDRLREFVSLVKASRKVDIARLANALGLDDSAARARAESVASQFGFKVDGHAISFEKGDKAGFIKSLAR